MDVAKCAIVSVAETVLLLKLGRVGCHGFLGQAFGLFVAQYIAVKLYFVLIWPFLVSPLRHLPGPKGGNLVLGQLLNQVKALPSELEKKWMADAQDAPFIRYLSFLNTEVLMVNSARAHKAVLQTKCYSFVKPRYYERVVGEIAGHGILFTEGEEHKKQRKLLLAPFSFSNIKRLLPFFEVKAREMSSILKSQLGPDGYNVLEVSELLSKTTLDVVGLAALGYELNSLSTPSQLATSYGKIFEFATPLQILISVVHQFVPIRQWLPLKTNQSFVQANATVRKILREHIRKRKSEFRKGLIKGEKGNRDLLTLMIEESKDTWSEDEMLGYVVTALPTDVSSSGHETTAGALTWTLYALTLHTQVQDRLRAEILSTVTSSSPSYEELDNMRFLNNVMKEVLRYYPPAPTFPRQAAEDVEIEGVRILKGTLIMIAPAAPQYNTHIWGPNAEQFDPDRYDHLPEPANDPYVSLAFSAGPRVCIGKSFATLEFKAILTELIRNFSFENTGLVEPQKSGPSLRPLNGMRLKVRLVS
ncbi:uncharacterized protein Z519_08680 [Cladophialophora bantiana CBS 173.52]|uniref:Cytochrome P450 n=1 Tax=Cladophialophora bantiana (strain ATCC 10958 / CBS 173.52 / CDC B-1940 / NIH 8579) TaxID=1442370 RepID=A0A0D2FWK9_CLAB1|nr:uncharacterized protein Z519_08680 [Cladophialophora bantiana CBS 173.52]KIW90897.1 hypothetical protein Z519_08680 [Cladophialophora bantiana CBS 173.52]